MVNPVKKIIGTDKCRKCGRKLKDDEAVYCEKHEYIGDLEWD